MRGTLRFLLLLVLILVAVWLGLWWYAQGRLEAGVIGWANRMNGHGDVHVSYDSLTRGSSPLTATVKLTNLHITVQTAGVAIPVSIVLPSFALRIDAANPMVVHYDLPGQINFNAAQGAAEVTFGTISSAMKLDPQAMFNGNIYPFRGGELTAGNINLLASEGSLLVLHASDFGLHANITPPDSAGNVTFAENYALDGVALSPLMTKIFSVPFGGQIAHLGMTLNFVGPGPQFWQDMMAQLNALPLDDQAGRKKILFQNVQKWAANNGSASGSVNLVLGPTTLNAAGSVSFDKAQQPSGKGDLSANHLDGLTTAIINAYPQAQDDISMAQAMLSPYLSSDTANGQTLNVHLTYGNGAVTINGQKVSDMPSINWQTLENPPPPPATAPGDGSGAAQ
ncbi:MAG: hypothetical protein B7X08_05640 [Acidocella sp. 20-63-7]|nr:MAG: hypothetical protein B7X08_05640 [Acidocella sp. 20-63-7]HQT46363.1 DUF2125 domain-containing protein [Acidocella sp.]